MDVQRIAAFSQGATGGNPAGVVLCATLPSAEEMQFVAAEVGYSETAFAAPQHEGFRVRYFAPEMEVPFCGHATIALGAVLTLAHGDGVFQLQMNTTRITVEGRRNGSALTAALQSPATRSSQAPRELVDATLAIFSYRAADLDPRIPPAIAEAGARHLVLALNSRQRLAAMRYDFDAGRRLMTAAGLVTISLVFAETDRLFHARNPFAAGGVYEDPATGSAAAALAGYLRDLEWRAVYENGGFDATLAMVRIDMAIAATLATTVPGDLDVISSEAGLPLLPSFAINLHLPDHRPTTAVNELARFIREGFARPRQTG